jgi:hypothetical protein
MFFVHIGNDALNQLNVEAEIKLANKSQKKRSEDRPELNG